MTKKITLTVFFSMFICVFVLFNYLLISQEDKDAAIDRQTAEIKILSEEKNEMVKEWTRQSEEAAKEIDGLKEKNAEQQKIIDSNDADKGILSDTITELTNALKNFNDFIIVLKKSLNSEIVGRRPREWIESINNKKYDEAHAKYNYKIDDIGPPMILNEFTAYYKKNIEMIDVKSIAVKDEGVPDIYKDNIVLSVILDIITPHAYSNFCSSLKIRLKNDEIKIYNQAFDAAIEDLRRKLEADSALNAQNAPEEPEEPGGAEGGGATGPGAGVPGTPESGSDGAGSGDMGSAGGAGGKSEIDADTSEDAVDPMDFYIKNLKPSQKEEMRAPYLAELMAPYDKESYPTAGSVLKVMDEYPDYIYIDDRDDSIFKTGENQLYFIMALNNLSTDWQIIKVLQSLSP